MRGVKARSADSLLDWSTALRDLQVPGSLRVFIDEVAADKLSLQGGVMNGPLILAGDATNSLGAVTLQQVTSMLATNGKAAWGSITGTISSQTDLMAILDTKLEQSDIVAQVNADWSADTGVASILNKPTLGVLAGKDQASIADIEASGVPSQTTYLSGAGVWSDPTKVTEYATQLTITSDQTLEIKQTTTSGVLLVGIESTSSAQDLHDIEIHDGTPGPGTLRYFARQVSGTFRDFVPTYCKLTSNQLVLKVVNLRSDGQDLNTSLKVLHMFGG